MKPTKRSQTLANEDNEPKGNTRVYEHERLVPMHAFVEYHGKCAYISRKYIA